MFYILRKSPFIYGEISVKEISEIRVNVKIRMI